MQIDFVDAFVTHWPFSGSPVAVVRSEQPLPDALMQHLAAQHNLAATTCLWQLLDDPHAHWQVQFFSPTRRLDMAAHGLLAAASLLMRETSQSEAWFNHPQHGVLMVQATEQGLTVDLPHIALRRVDPAPVLLLAALPPRVHEVLRGSDWLVVYDDPSHVFNCNPERHALLRLPDRGIVVTAPGIEDCDYVCRYFAPKQGIYEEPAGDIAHRIAAPYWATRLSKNQLSGYQASERGGRVTANLSQQRVLLSGYTNHYATAYVHPEMLQRFEPP